MSDAIGTTIDLVSEFFRHGFLATLALAVAAPILGTFIVLKRLPLLALAIPQTAACGTAGVFYGFAAISAVSGGMLAQPSPTLQVAGASGAIGIALVILVLAGRRGGFSGVHSGIVYIVAVALTEVFYFNSPYHELFEDALHHGRILTVDSAGMWRVIITCSTVMSVAVFARRPFLVSAFDPDQARLLRLRPELWFFAWLSLVGALSALCVHVVGPEPVFTLFLVPPALLRGVTPSLRLYAPLCAIAGILGTLGAFVLACAKDWPPNPALIVCVLAASLIVGATCFIVRFSVVTRRKTPSHPKSSPLGHEPR